MAALLGPNAAAMNPAPSPYQAMNLDASQAPAPQQAAPVAPTASHPIIPAARKQAVLDENLGPVKRGINKSEELKATGDQKTVQQNNLLYSPEQLAAETEAWANLPQFKEQQNAIDNQKKIFSLMASQPTQTDLSPLSRLVDSWYGTKLSEGYNKPQTPQEKLAALAGYGNKLAGDQSQLTGNIIKAFGDSRAGMSTAMQQLLQTEMVKNAVGLGNQRPNNFGPQNFKSYEKFANDQMGGEKSGEQATELKNMAQLVNDNNNPTGLKELPLRLDKFITGSARISDSQIRMLGGDPAKINQIEQSIRSALPELTDGGYLTEKNKKEYLALFQQYADERNKLRQLKAKWLTSPAQLAHHGVDETAGKTAIPDDMVNIYSMPGGGGGKSDYDGSSALPPNATTDQKQKRLEFLKRKAGQ